MMASTASHGLGEAPISAHNINMSNEGELKQKTKTLIENLQRPNLLLEDNLLVTPIPFSALATQGAAYDASIATQLLEMQYTQHPELMTATKAYVHSELPLWDEFQAESTGFSTQLTWINYLKFLAKKLAHADQATEIRIRSFYIWFLSDIKAETMLRQHSKHNPSILTTPTEEDKDIRTIVAASIEGDYKAAQNHFYFNECLYKHFRNSKRRETSGLIYFLKTKLGFTNSLKQEGITILEQRIQDLKHDKPPYNQTEYIALLKTLTENMDTLRQKETAINGAGFSSSSNELATLWEAHAQVSRYLQHSFSLTANEQNQLAFHKHYPLFSHQQTLLHQGAYHTEAGFISKCLNAWFNRRGSLERKASIAPVSAALKELITLSKNPTPTKNFHYACSKYIELLNTEIEKLGAEKTLVCQLKKLRAEFQKAVPLSLEPGTTKLTVTGSENKAPDMESPLMPQSPANNSKAAVPFFNTLTTSNDGSLNHYQNSGDLSIACT